MTFLKHCKTGLLAFWLAPKNHEKSGLHHEPVAPQQTPGTAAALPHRLSALQPVDALEKATLMALRHARDDRSNPLSRKVA